jgi:hypothetical protein
VQLTNATRLKVHVNSGDLIGNREIGLGDLAGPAAALLAPGGEMLNEDQKNGWVLTSVAGAVIKLGNWLSSTGFRGPVIVVLAGSPVVFTMPSWGRSGFPEVGVS